ncbi:hypothetical protein ISN44_As06g001470 [Arabidopsis suecica]|uniref:Amine oxidase domain-containing protein n=1 Tax=Arabidopsis suecica TaxID=45249 RepID=A0A8T2C5Z1_ARASU|nr:hypothetical protein ISN44_As06g001470 [Arabidopsis suecica]
MRYFERLMEPFCSVRVFMLALAKAKGPNSWFLQERTHGRHPEAISARLVNKVKVSWKLSKQKCSDDCPISFASSLLHPHSNFPMMSDLMKLLKLCHLSSGHDGIFLGGNYVAAGVALGQCVEGTYKTAIPSQ